MTEEMKGRKNPPKKKKRREGDPPRPPQPRRFDGEVWDIATGAKKIGENEKAVRSQIKRGLLPHRRFGGRVILIADEVRTFIKALPGVTVEQALQNMAARHGEGDPSR